MSRCDRALARACWRAAAAAAAALALGGCGLLGGPAGLKQDDPQVMTVTSPAFGQEPLPAQYTCHGKGENPPVYWSGAPQGTKALALVVDDADAPITPYVYWIVYNISPDSPDIQAGRLRPVRCRPRTARAPRDTPHLARMGGISTGLPSML